MRWWDKQEALLGSGTFLLTSELPQQFGPGSPLFWPRTGPPQGCSLGDSGLIALIDHKFFLI